MRAAGIWIVGLLVWAAVIWAAEPSARDTEERLLLHTTMGDLVLAFYPDIAPKHVEQVLRLARLGVYDSTLIRDVRPGYVIQLGDPSTRLIPLTTEQQMALQPIAAEFSSLKRHRGTLSMARLKNGPNSAVASFCILLDDAPHLDGQYTIFGRLERGEDVLDAITAVETDQFAHPIDQIQVVTAEVVTLETLARIALRGAIPQATRPREISTATVWIQWMIGAMVLLGLAVFLMAGRMAAPLVAALGLLVVLVGGFALFVLFAPTARFSAWLGVILFVGLVATFKLMSRFESPR